MKRPTAYYNGEGTVLPTVQRMSHRLFAIVMCLAILLSFAGASGVLLSTNKTSVAAADDDEEKPEDKFEKALKEYDDKAAPKDNAGFAKMVETYQGGDRAKFGSVIERLITPQYLNHTPEGVGRDGEERVSNCNTADPGAGTALYHNCDVPNLAAEILQKVVSLLSPMGVQGATVEAAHVPGGWGIPSNIPKDEVPIKPTDRHIKYTGLELFGYNMRLISYSGEWDHIQVMTKARAMMNFGLLDTVRLGVRSVANGVWAGLKNGANTTVDRIKSGQVLGAIGGFFTGFFEGAASETVHTLLDSSDLNVFNSYAWYRVSYGATLYNARELSQIELKGLMTESFEKRVNDNKSTENQKLLPADFTALKGGPPKPKDATPTCKNSKGKVIVAPTEADCVRLKGTWKLDGGGTGETLVKWKENNKTFFDGAKKYDFSCEIDTGEGNRTTKLSTFYTCWETAYTQKENELVEQGQEEGKSVPQSIFDSLFKGISYRIYMMTNKRANFNSPYNRYVCTDKNGADMFDNEQPIFYFTTEGQKDSRCQTMRPPIQNGYYGNGYGPGAIDTETGPNSTVKPPTDTRFSLVDQAGPFGSMFNSFGTNTGTEGLKVASFATQISNTALDLSFSPIMQKLGIDKKIITLITGFREGVFFPLASLVILVGLLQVVLRTFRRQAYMQGLKDMIIIVLIFFVGSVMLFKPDKMFTLVDSGPAQVEAAIIGTIYDVANPNADPLCSASQSPVESETGLDGEKLPFSPTSATRGMMCDVWRAFVFEPYVAAQWGTNYNSLFAAGKTQKDGESLKNTNADLVGNAEVDMGGGFKINNWGLYQLSLLTSGTTTEQDLTKPTGQTPKDIYRIVDLQGGPNNGAGRDPSHLASWAGTEPISRGMVGILSAIAGIAGAITVTAYALLKIQLTFVSAFMLIFLPFALLLGLHPTAGRTQFLRYTGTLISLMIRRVVLVTALAVMMKVLLAGSMASPNYLLQGIATTAICVAFLIFKSKLQDLFVSPITNKFGPAFAERFSNDPRSAIQNAMPRSIANYMDSQREQGRAAVSAGLGGFANGGVKGVKKSLFGQKADPNIPGSGYQGALDFARQRAELNQLRGKGFGAVQSYHKAAELGKSDAQRRIRSSDSYRKTNEALRDRFVKDNNREILARDSQEYQQRKRDIENAEAEGVNLSSLPKTDDDPSGDTLKDRLAAQQGDYSVDIENRGDIRDIRTLRALDAKIARLENSEHRKFKATKDKIHAQKNLSTAERVKLEQEAIEMHRKSRVAKLDNLKAERDRAIDRMYRRHNDPDYRGKTAREKMGADINRMRENVEATIERRKNPEARDQLNNLRDRKRKVTGFDVYAYEDAVVAMTMEKAGLLEELIGRSLTKQEITDLAQELFNRAEHSFQPDRDRMSAQVREKAMQSVIDTVYQEGT